MTRVNGMEWSGIGDDVYYVIVMLCYVLGEWYGMMSVSCVSRMVDWWMG